MSNIAARSRSSRRFAHSLNNIHVHEIPIVCTATVDYSAANEYASAHYNIPRYFDYDNEVQFAVDHPIYDGRVLQSKYHDEREMLSENGLALIKSPIRMQRIDWSNVNDVRESYLPELERILVCNLFASHKIFSCCFWNPMLRGEGLKISRNEGGTSTANIASLVHIDTDVGAYESIDELLNAVDKNKVEYTSTAVTDFNVKEMASLINEKKRFAIINFWRNIDDEPVSSAPLAILSTRYNEDEHQHRLSGLPNSRPDMKQSRYYVFPLATKDEVIVFYQYDRNAKQTSDMWHCAIKPQQQQHHGVGNEESTRPRRSFDIRAMVVFDENVPEELDRFGADRIRPKLTMEESECLCEKQGEDRRSKTK